MLQRRDVLSQMSGNDQESSGWLVRRTAVVVECRLIRRYTFVTRTRAHDDSY